MLRYESIHGGDHPLWDQRMTVCVGTGRGVGILTEISYAKQVDGQSEIYRHKLKAHDGRRPYLISDIGHGPPISVSHPPKDLLALGRAIDCVLDTGERIVLGGLFVVTDDQGEVVLLATPFDVSAQIEQRGAFVTTRGIEE